MDNASKYVGSLLGLGLVLTLSGCPNPNTYGTPRTTPVGKVAHSIAAEAIGATGGGVSVGPFPAPPTYTLRVGVADNADIGVRLGNMSTLGVDGKYNFIKTHGLDVAVDPGAQFFYFSASSSAGTASASTSITGTYLHLPLLLGVNVGDSLTFVPTAGIMYGIVSGSSTASSGDSKDSVKASSNTGLIGR